MFKNKCCDSATSYDKFCGNCGTNLELERQIELERQRERQLQELKGICDACGFSGQYQSYCTRCGKKMLSKNLEKSGKLRTNPSA